ncbi:MAG: glycogen debranching enzyme N-terminal domain-containing protein [Sediminibacterium sp.]|nr:glycogen debranching enzyme N-terminal domain-containing protein [Sediminibacterium sp.]
MVYSEQDVFNKEFLITNGIGGYCSSSIGGANTRRYHGLLVASFNPPVDRKVLISSIDESVIYHDQTFELSTHQYPGVVSPQGFRYLKSFFFDTHVAEWIYQFREIILRKTIQMIPLQNTTIITYTNLYNASFDLKLLPLLSYRNYHSLFYENSTFDFYKENLNLNQFKIYASYGVDPFYISFTKGQWNEENFWYKNFEYIREQERGFDFTEDAKSIGFLKVLLNKGESVSIQFSTFPNLIEKNIVYCQKPSTNFGKDFINDLQESSRQFVVQRNSTKKPTIIAGYPWFTDWGRDTMIALRGISIATGKHQEAKNILETFLVNISKGMLPNRFPDFSGDEIEYNTSDAALWFFIAMYEYYQKFLDKSFINKSLPYLQDIIQHYISGTRFHIQQLSEGLIYGGQEGYQLTWMDALVDGFVVTPRIGCAVEINALWFNALNIYTYFQTELGLEVQREYILQIKQFPAIFQKYFYNEKGYLNDVVIPEKYVDDSIRPNQIYAVSLPYSPLPKNLQQSVIKCVEEKLLTPYGLRTLNSTHPEFKPIYNGNAFSRDTAYHQGTVWAFLWAEWALAYLKANKFSKNACNKIWNESQVLQNHFYNEGCVGGISEIFDGLDPNIGKGCVQQAWSVGNLLFLFLHPEFKK